MMLRASSDANGLDLDLDVIRGDQQDSDAIEHSAELTALVDASLGSDAELAAARTQLATAAGDAVMVDAAAVVANFEMMTRIADGTGTRHPDQRLEAIADLRGALELDEFVSARLDA